MSYLLRNRLLMSGLCWQRWTTFINLSRNLSRIKKNERANHYKTLGLTESCAQEDIKPAFLEKSKELHPDKNPKNPETHRLFVAVNEAYSVLSKPHSRSAYDHYLVNERLQNYHPKINDTRVFYDDSIWEHRTHSEDYKYERKPYYGINGVKRVPNSYIAGGVVLFMVIGATVHYFLAKVTSSFTSKELEKQNFITNQHYLMAKMRAKQNGIEKQIDFFRLENEKRSLEKD